MNLGGIPGVVLRPREPHPDDRGRFVEVLRQSERDDELAQCNHSSSKAGVLRGLHFHRLQSDLWYVVSGSIQVGLADLRPAGRGAVEVVELDAGAPQTLFIPPGVAHGYLALTDAELLYWVSREYDGSDEFGIAWDDATLAVPWKIEEPVLSRRDAANPPLVWDALPSFS